MSLTALDTASFQFVLFGLAAALISNFSRAPLWRSAVLLVSSVMLLALLASDVRSLLPFAGFVLLGYLCLLAVERGIPRAVTVGVLVILFSYMWLKKYTVLPQTILLHVPYFTLGLSYIFFRILSLLIETGDRSRHEPVGFGSYLLYTLNFTTLLSGPIQRYDEFARDQFAPVPLPLGPRVIGLQLERIIRGFFKVNIAAMFLHAFQNDFVIDLAQPWAGPHRWLIAAALAVIYPFYIYNNFSGYIDIVIAIARLMRVRLPENFDRPFAAASFLEFWSRWHMSLSNWFKNYLYNPMLVALMRRVTSVALQPFLAVLCFFVTFFLVGVWHGRTSEFVMYGVLQGLGVSINKLWQVMLTKSLGRKGYGSLVKNAFYVACARGLTFSWFTFTLYWLWADWQRIGQLFGALNGSQWLTVWLAIWAGATVVLAAWEWLRAWLLSFATFEGPVLTSRYARVVYASALGLIALVLTILADQPAPGIVYKAF